ncbi:tRNA lysidine(34) synthetase TilS [Usitatibacter palustris]|uniref:tRNA lysidine(34) synthetase TilS n=1 Tax=Usitatibacter palustris TaxID=2732487 RepID=UPI001489F081|nr:tRNA lysidine(34) synthetase TilS [Usitatibacter palustris]
MVLPRGSRVCVGFSGGLDSVVLLDALHEARESSGITLSAIHVHHGLSPNADAWADFCAAFCAARAIPLEVIRVQLDRQSGQGIEAAARDARYAAYATREVDVIALAHHLDDQAETVLLQLLRGTGIKGAAAMPASRTLPGTSIEIVRPLLDMPRDTLLERARARGLEWVEDESNRSSVFDRNFLRNEIVPRLAERFPNWRDALARFARHAADADALLTLLARQDGVRADALPTAALTDPARRANALRAFLHANALPMPGEARLDEMARQLFESRRDARVRIEHGGAALVCHRGEIRLDREPRPEAGWTLDWAGEPELALGEGRGVVRFARAEGEGICEDTTREAGWRFAPRAGGERLRLDAKRPNRALKNLLQESAVPVWQRMRLPLLFHRDQLVWVPGIGIAEAYRCPEGRSGLLPEWFFPPPA